MAKERLMRYAIVAVLAAIAAGACDGSGDSPSPTGPSLSTPTIGGLSIQGDPESPQGATWTYRETIGGINFDLQGILRKPTGRGPFPAVIISHGVGGNVNTYSLAVASVMVAWGLVAIATNYTHAGGVPIGAPGSANEPGSSEANILRAHAVFGILRLLGYVDMARVAAHGNSAGAFVTSAVLDAHPADFRVASHTAGGVLAAGVFGAAPNESQVGGIRTPYQLHHGDADAVVPLAADQRLADVLRAAGVPHELHIYIGVGHGIPLDTVLLGRIRSWYAAHGLF
jgi:dienelactone hydrolase